MMWEGGNVGRWEGEEGAATAPADAVIHRFEDLRVWQSARELLRGVYRAEKSQPLGRDRVFSNPMRRAALSIGSNIAEGYERGTRRQQIEACFIAKGSAGELRSQVIMAHDVGLIDDACRAWFVEHCEKCSGQIARYIEHLKRTSKEIPGLKFADEEHAT